MSNTTLGIDVGKFELAIALRKDGKFTDKLVENNSKGFQKILKFLEKNAPEAEVYLEATGRYGESITNFLFAHGFDVKVVNPLKIKAFSQLKMSRQKTDKVDAQIIAEFGAKFGGRSYTPIAENLKELRELYRTNCALKDELTSCKNHLENKELIALSVREIWENIVQKLEEEIKNCSEKMKKIIEEDKELKVKKGLLIEIPGVGEETARAFLAEVPRLNEFRTARELAAFIGLTPQHRFSGSSVRGRPRISKMGLKILRKAFYLPAITAMRFNPSLKIFSENLRNRGKKGKQIICAVMRKLVHIIFGVLKYDFHKLALDL